ncbi:ABC zinc transporter, periplasmic binding protein ZnuA [Sulfitobacter noctilucicola]|uniref:High-affinity zinc uptake system protein ZnuA n=1 Tax=Sulfitobacter noctilucicola TaxID=1342301 RepID=A0A7W6MAR0_9RHOB|nr:zinc ABC transporter substrate-binding protein [Sulfitobacter noctilucicola]KIN66251.1 ABC zinc transporter, periplasmic binding protein ZnuA [Sulfitobacter noctilucicola]MBB4175605.1 zinc transport system substrate-binding protein [Sulfitobacter noctilucicola]
MRRLFFVFCAVPTMGWAEVPRVVVDIAPVHGLVARIMDGVGSPELLLPPTASPHSYAMRPSEARMLSKAELFVWVGPELTPWLEDAVENLADQSVQMALLDQATALPARVGLSVSLEDAHDDDHDSHDEEHDGHDDHDDHDKDHVGHDGHDDHEDHEDGHDDHDKHDEDKADHAHDHSDHVVDPHGWLDPSVGVIWAESITDQLSALDPENKEKYAANLASFAEEVTAFSVKWTGPLSEVSDQRYIVLHDAFQYFEKAYDLSEPLAIAPSDASEPGAARIADLKAAISASGATCAFSEPQNNTRMITLVTEGLDFKAATLDPMGSDLPLGPDHYLGTIDALAGEFLSCLSR